MQRQPFHQLFLIMAAAALLVSAVSIFSIYMAVNDQHQLRLLETVKGQARVIEAIFQLDQLDHEDNDPTLALQATLEKLAVAHQEFDGFGKTGDFVLARRDGDQIRFVLSREQSSGKKSKSIPFAGKWAEPMRRALAGDSGVMTGLDYRGELVLAAYEPLSLLEFGLVAKMDLSEIRRPFVRAALIALGITLLVIFIASRFFFRVLRPIEDIIDQQAETFRTLAETAREAIVISDTSGTIQFVNPATERLFGYRQGELKGLSIKCLMPVERSVEHDGYVERYLQTGLPRIIGSGRQLVAVRKDGTRFPIYLSIGDINTSHARLFAGVIMDISEQQQLQREILEIPVSEQRRIGQELHDGLGQQLTGLGLLATSLANKASKPEHELATRLAAGLQEAISQVRTLSRGLMPMVIEAEGFTNSLQILADEVRAQSNVDVKLTVDQTIRILDNASAMHLYRITQESINNAIKHSKASRIDVTVGMTDKRGFVSIRDNGLGFDSHANKSQGLGLRIMQHRCGLIDAELRIESAEDDGTQVTCYFSVES